MVTVAVAKVAAARVAVKAPTGPCTPKIGVGLIPDDALEHIFTRAVCDDHPEGRLLRTTFRGGYRYKEVNAFKGVCVGWRARRVARFTKYVHTRVCRLSPPRNLRLEVLNLFQVEQVLRVALGWVASRRAICF